ncbi:MAG: outer membrane beta-barrel protein, partial [Bacteroidota bacterium]
MTFQNGLFLQTGGVYDTRKVSDNAFVSVDSRPYESVFTLEVSYLSFPLMAGYQFGQGELCPYFSAGLQFGTGLTNEASNVYEEEPPSFVTKNEPLFDFETTEFGLLAEIGIRQTIGAASTLQVGAQYMGGDRGTFVSSSSSAAGAVNLGTQKIAVTVAFLFRFYSPHDDKMRDIVIKLGNR